MGGSIDTQHGWQHKSSRRAAIGWVFVEIFCCDHVMADFFMVINMTRPLYGEENVTTTEGQTVFWILFLWLWEVAERFRVTSRSKLIIKIANYFMITTITLIAQESGYRQK